MMVSESCRTVVQGTKRNILEELTDTVGNREHAESLLFSLVRLLVKVYKLGNNLVLAAKACNSLKVCNCICRKQVGFVLVVISALDSHVSLGLKRRANAHQG